MHSYDYITLTIFNTLQFTDIASFSTIKAVCVCCTTRCKECFDKLNVDGVSSYLQNTIVNALNFLSDKGQSYNYW